MGERTYGQDPGRITAIARALHVEQGSVLHIIHAGPFVHLTGGQRHVGAALQLGGVDQPRNFVPAGGRFCPVG